MKTLRCKACYKIISLPKESFINQEVPEKLNYELKLYTCPKCGSTRAIRKDKGVK